MSTPNMETMRDEIRTTRTVEIRVMGADPIEYHAGRQIRRFRPYTLAVVVTNGSTSTFRISGRRVLKDGSESIERESIEYRMDGTPYASWRKDAPAPAWAVDAIRAALEMRA